MIDIDKLEALNKGDFDKRRDINRDAKAQRAQAEGILVPAGTPAEPIDEGEFLNKIQAAGEHNAADLRAVYRPLLVDARRLARAIARVIEVTGLRAEDGPRGAEAGEPW